MKPGLARAVPMGILGFVGGALIAIVIRLLQGLDPNPAAPYAYVGPAMVLGAFISAGVFVWGMGGFDPSMSVHGEEHHEEEESHPEPEVATPTALLGGFTWQIFFWVVLLVFAIAAFAWLPAGPTLQAVNGNGNVADVGYASLGQIYTSISEFTTAAAGVRLPAISDQLAAVQISYLVLFILFVLWTIFSLFVVAGALAFIISGLSRAVKNPEDTRIPWRLIGLIAIMGGLMQMPIIAPALDVPMALLIPAYLIPIVLFLIAYRSPILIVLLLLALALPVLVPSVNIGNVWIVYNLLIVFILQILALRAVKPLVSEAAWLNIATAVFGFTLAVAFIYSVIQARPDFWQIIFLIVVELAVALLILPVPVLKRLLGGVWQKFAAVRWQSIIPDFAGWLSGILRQGLPRFLGQR